MTFDVSVGNCSQIGDKFLKFVHQMLREDNFSKCIVKDGCDIVKQKRGFFVPGGGSGGCLQ